MEACFKPLLSLCKLLPVPLQNETKDFSSDLLSKSIEVLNCEREFKYYEKKSTYLSSPLRFKFLLTYKAEYEVNKEFEEQRPVANKILDDTKISLYKCCVKVMRIEKEGAIDKLHNKFINGLLRLLEYITNY